METQNAINILRKNYPKIAKMVDGRYKGGFDDLECELGQAITTAIVALEVVQKIPALIEQLERYKCSKGNAVSTYEIGCRNVHYNDAIILIKEMLN